MTGKYLFVSIGHHEKAKGAQNDTFSEFAMARIWANLVQKEMQGSYTTIVVPEGTLKQKVAFINEHATSDSIAIEIHFNSNTPVMGSECLTYPRSTKGIELGNNIQRAFQRANIFQPNRGVKEGWYHGSHGEKKMLYFCAKTSCPAIVVEPQFIYQKHDIINNTLEGCKAIAEGCKQYLDNN